MYVFRTKAEMLKWALLNASGTFSYLIEESDWVISRIQLVARW